MGKYPTGEWHFDPVRLASSLLCRRFNGSTLHYLLTGSSVGLILKTSAKEAGFLEDLAANLRRLLTFLDGLSLGKQAHQINSYTETTRAASLPEFAGSSQEVERNIHPLCNKNPSSHQLPHLDYLINFKCYWKG